jgi:hypothetical protein
MVPLFWATDALPESLLNVFLINLHGSRHCFAYRDHRHNYAHHRNDRSDRSETRPLCPISRPRSNVDAYGIDRHRDGPFGERKWFRHVQALDRHGRCEVADGPLIQPIDPTKNPTDGELGRRQSGGASTAFKGQAPRCPQRPPPDPHGAVTLSPKFRHSFPAAVTPTPVIAGCPPWFQKITSRKNCGHK